jgi:hypothetical protein
MSARLAIKVTGITSGGPPLLGSVVAVAVGLAVAVAVGLAVIPPPRCWSAKAAEESSSTSTAPTVNRSRTFFMWHPLYALLRCLDSVRVLTQ